MAKPRHILVIRLSAIGDVAMLVPVLQVFTATYPDVKITVLSKAFLKPLFTNMPNVSFFTADVNGKHKGVFGLYRLFKELKALKIEAVADAHNVLRSKILGFFFSLANVKQTKIDKGRAEKKALTRAENKVFKQLKTSHQRYADCFTNLGLPIDLSVHKFPKSAPLTADVLIFLEANAINLKKDILMGIAPFAQYVSKMYPLELMTEIITSLSKTPHIKILLFGGGKSETEKLETIATQIPNTLNVSGNLAFADELNLISYLKLMLSMDSANAHLAAMKNVKTLTLWGVTHPFAGFSPFKHNLDSCLLPDLEQYPNIPCSIYGNKVCEGYANCMESILPKTVVEAVFKELR